MDTALFAGTPTVTVLDSRGLAVRAMAYCRHPETRDTTDRRVTHHRYDARGRLVQSADPRMFAVGRTNLHHRADLTGAVLYAKRADTGINLSLNDAVSRPLITLSNLPATDNGAANNGKALTCTWQYEAPALAGRLSCVTERTAGHPARVVERFVYAGASYPERAQNLAGRCLRHFDTAGLLETLGATLTGVPQTATRRLLHGADDPDVSADWQGATETDWNDLLEQAHHTSRILTDATGAVLGSLDAEGHQQRNAYDVAGQLAGSWVTLAGGNEQVVVKALTWSAARRKLREEHGNGLVTTFTYEAHSQRLVGIETRRPQGHVAGAKVLQDLHYAYDPVGNVLKVCNDAEEIRFWRNQKVVPENTYLYDSLYQLISASGREMAKAGQQSVHLAHPTDPAAYTQYTRTYRYDAAGNLTQIRHSAPATNNRYTLDITVSDTSNRGVLSTLAATPVEVDALFTAGGQQTQLQPGQALTWTPRNELLEVTPVARDGAQDDRESYRYDATRQRVLKVRRQLASGTLHTQRALYLPGLEVRTKALGGSTTECLHVVAVGEAGQAQVRLLHWVSGEPAEITNDQLRYSYDGLTGSSGLEVDGNGQLMGVEEYYPYGGTALSSARSQVEASYKTLRYSGKERDATGLYYYGYRYYQPWVGRWLSADPAGTVDGLNLFRMCRNNPCSGSDSDGRMWQQAEDDELRVLADRLGRQNRSELLGILGLTPEPELTLIELAKYIYDGLGDGVPTMTQAMVHLQHLESSAAPDTAGPAPRHAFASATQTQQAPTHLGASSVAQADGRTLSPDADPATLNRIERLRERIQHTLHGSGITSIIGEDTFDNVYYPDRWIFDVNYRLNPDADYFASDVVALQYELVSKKYGFYLKAPQKIIRRNVENEWTLSVMADLPGSGLPLRQPFLWKTPNGKSTVRIMDFYGLEATRVTAEENTFTVDVKLKPKNLWRPWTR